MAPKGHTVGRWWQNGLNPVMLAARPLTGVTLHVTAMHMPQVLICFPSACADVAHVEQDAAELLI